MICHARLRIHTDIPSQQSQNAVALSNENRQNIKKGSRYTETIFETRSKWSNISKYQITWHTFRKFGEYSCEQSIWSNQTLQLPALAQKATVGNAIFLFQKILSAYKYKWYLIKIPIKVWQAMSENISKCCLINSFDSYICTDVSMRLWQRFLPPSVKCSSAHLV